MTVKAKRTKRKDAKVVQDITKPKLVYPTYKKVQPRKKGKTFTPTELKELKKLAKTHDEETGYAILDVPVELSSDPTIKKTVDKDMKAKLKKQREKAEAGESIRKMPEMIKATYVKDGKTVTEFVVAGDPKLKELAAIKRQQIKPLTEQEMARIRQASVRQSAEHLEAAQLYQDQLKAQKFLASLHKGRIKPFPKHGFPIFKIVAAYHKRKPRWRLRIRRNIREGYVYLQIVGPREKLAGREAVHNEASRILTLMNMRFHPSATVEDVRSPVVRGKYAFVNVKVRANKVGEGEIRSRLARK